MNRRYENELIVSMAKRNIDNREYIISLLQNEMLDWGYLLLNIYKNKISSLFLDNLISNNLVQYVQSYIVNILRNSIYVSKIKAQNLRNELLNLAEVLENNKINYVILKGAVLGEKYYKTEYCYLRDFNDVDILVAEYDLSRVKKILNCFGFVQGYFDYNKNILHSASREEMIESKIISHQLYPFVKLDEEDAYGILIKAVDVNFSIFFGGKKPDIITTKNLLERRQRLYLDEKKYIYTLNNYDMFIQFVFHIYKDMRYESKKKELADVTLLKFCDLREFYLNTILVEKDLLSIINENNLNKESYLVLYYTDYIFKDLKCKSLLEQIALKLDECYLREVRECVKELLTRMFKVID